MAELEHRALEDLRRQKRDTNGIWGIRQAATEMLDFWTEI